VLSAGRFANGAGDTDPDAVEVVYADGGPTTMIWSVSFSAVKTAVVVDTSGFQVGDFVLLGDFDRAVLTRIAAVAPGTPGPLPAGTIKFGALPAVPGASIGLTIDTGSSMQRARSVAFYIDAASRMLMYDPDGMAGTDHTDAQPLVEGAGDFQI